MDQYLLLALAALPPIVILFIVYLYQNRETPRDKPFLAYFIGACLAVPVSFSQEFLMENVLVPGLIALAFILGGLVEEGGKYLALKFSIEEELTPQKEEETIYDVVVTSLAISMGFATSENIIYVLNSGVEAGILRMLTAIPLHAICGIIMGFFYGHALAFSKSVKYALVFPILIHGFYNLIAFWPPTSNNIWFIGIFLFFVGTVAVGIVYGVKKFVVSSEDDFPEIEYLEGVEEMKHYLFQVIVGTLGFVFFIFLIDGGYLDWLKPILKAIEDLIYAVFDVFKNLFK